MYVFSLSLSLNHNFKTKTASTDICSSFYRMNKRTPSNKKSSSTYTTSVAHLTGPAITTINTVVVTNPDTITTTPHGMLI